MIQRLFFHASLIVIFEASIVASAAAQETIEPTRYFTFDTGAIPKTLLLTPPDDFVQLKISEFSQGLDSIPPFNRRACREIQTISVAFQEGKWYLIYNPDWLNPQELEKDTIRAVRSLSLATALGHIANEHKLGATLQEDILEASEFAGYVLYRNNFAFQDINQLSARAHKQSMVDMTSLNNAISFGFQKAELRSLVAPSAGFFVKNRDFVSEGIRSFHAYPPSTWCDISSFFKDCIYYGGIDTKLSRVLQKAGYEFSYFRLPKGFAIVTKLEQHDSEGVPLSDLNRWKTSPVRLNNFNLDVYMKALFGCTPGNFRIFAFLVSPDPLTTEKQSIEWGEAIAWLRQGADRLPDALLKTQANNALIKTWVYEFQMTLGAAQGDFLKNGLMSAEKHLEKSGISNELKH
jgi:hypothetical protein